MPSKEKKLAEAKILEDDTTKCRLLRKRTSGASMPDSKKTKNKFLVSPKSNASLSSETEAQLSCMKCPKCFYECKSSVKYKKHSCKQTLAYMKSCVVVLNIFPGLDINTKGNMLFFQCRQCSRFFIDGYSYSQHLLTHSEGQCNRSIKTISLNINSSYLTIDDDKTLLDADANTITNDNKVTSLNPDESTSKASPDNNDLASNSPKKSRLVYFISNVKSDASLSSETESKLAYINCPKCFYKCKSSIKYQKHSCDKTLAFMKSCVVVLNIFPGLDLNTRGNTLFFECRQCSRFFIDGYSYSKHLSTHPKEQFNRSIKTVSLNINSFYRTPTISDDVEMLNDDHVEMCLDKDNVEMCLDDDNVEMCLDEDSVEMHLDDDKKINHNGSNVISVNPNDSTTSASPDSRNLVSNAQKKSRCCIS